MPISWLKSEYYGIFLYKNEMEEWNEKKKTRNVKTCKKVASKKIKRWYIHFGLFYLSVTSKPDMLLLLFFYFTSIF